MAVPCECYGGWCFEGECSQGKNNAVECEWFEPHPGQTIGIEDRVQSNRLYASVPGYSVCTIPRPRRPGVRPRTPWEVHRSVVGLGDTVAWAHYKGRGETYTGVGLLVGEIPPRVHPDEMIGGLGLGENDYYRRYSSGPLPYVTFFVLSPRDHPLGRALLRRPLRRLLAIGHVDLDLSSARTHADGRPNKKLSEDQVYDIRCTYYAERNSETRIWTKGRLAQQYAVSPTTIYNIVVGDSWKRVGGPRMQVRAREGGMFRP